MADKKQSLSPVQSGGGIWKIVVPWVLFGATAIGIGIYAGVQSGKSAVTPGNVGEQAVATVNDEAITANDVYQLMLEQVGPQAVDQLIVNRLLDRKAEESNIEVTDDDLNAEVDKIKSSFPDEATFNQQLELSGYTLDKLKKQLTPQVKLTKLVSPGIEVTEEEIKTYYDTNKASFGTQEQVKASHILVETREEAEEIVGLLEGGADFATLAKERSKDGSAASGGDLGFFGRGQMVAPFEEAAFALDIGKISGVVESEFGFHIILLTDKQAASTPTYEEKKEDIRQTLFDQKLSTESQAFIEELRSSAKIENSLAPDEESAS